MKFLITGTSSGLGRHLFEFFGGTPYTRVISEKEIKNLKKSGVDIIIHAAFNSTRNVDSNNLYSYINDNILLTKKILNIPHKKFIFISSVDIYPKNDRKHVEDEIIDINKISGFYAITKAISEALVINASPNHLILRCSSLLGKYARKNSLVKIIEEDIPIVTLSPKSSLNSILHADVLEFIKLALDKNCQGIYNLSSSKNISLFEAAKMLSKKVRFGDYIYKVGNIENTKSSSLYSGFKRTTREIILEFISSSFKEYNY